MVPQDLPFFYPLPLLPSIHLPPPPPTLYSQAKDVQGEARAYSALGNCHRALGQHQESILCHKQDMILAEQLNDMSGLAVALANLGAVYQAQGDVVTALKYHQRYVDMVQTLGNKAGLAAAYANIASIYEAMGEYDKAIEAHSRHIDVARAMGDRVAEQKVGCTETEEDRLNMGKKGMEREREREREGGGGGGGKDLASFLRIDLQQVHLTIVSPPRPWLAWSW